MWITRSVVSINQLLHILHQFVLLNPLLCSEVSTRGRPSLSFSEFIWCRLWARRNENYGYYRRGFEIGILVVAMSWGCVCLFFCGIKVLTASLLHSLESLGLGRDHNRRGPHALQVCWAKFGRRAGLGVGSNGWSRTRFRSLGDCLSVGRWRLRISRGLAVFLEGRHCRNATSLDPGSHVVNHRLSGGGAWAWAVGAGRGEGVGLHQFGLWSFSVLPEIEVAVRVKTKVFTPEQSNPSWLYEKTMLQSNIQ